MFELYVEWNDTRLILCKKHVTAHICIWSAGISDVIDKMLQKYRKTRKIYLKFCINCDKVIIRDILLL